MGDWPQGPFDFRSDVWGAGQPARMWHELTGLPPDLTSVVWTTANAAMFMPFVIDQPRQLLTIRILNGAVINGNVDVGIYLPDGGGGGPPFNVPGTRLVSSGSTAQVGVDASQDIDVADRLLPAGLYFAAVAFDNNTAQIIRMNDQSLGARLSFIATLIGENASFPLPAVVSGTQAANHPVPMVVVHMNPLQ